ncbi:MAG: hypothetical protein GTO53_02085, partial [Planctomycetales bacterium]|nr:hypothetical protein [Planctomycetales bacterium]NIM07958.1 hypothetical protein [Planctomycetales bacterium]
MMANPTARNVARHRCPLMLIVLAGCTLAAGTSWAQSTFEKFYAPSDSMESRPAADTWEAYYSDTFSESSGTTTRQASPEQPLLPPAEMIPPGVSSQPVYYEMAATHPPQEIPYEEEIIGSISGPGHRGNALITAQRYDDHRFMWRADYVRLGRDDSADSIPLTSIGVDNFIVLSSADAGLEDDDAQAARGALYLDLFHSFDLELSWMGPLEWDNFAAVTSSTNSLYSIFSDFGLSPAQGFEETDQATDHSIFYKSQLNNYELNTRYRWSHTTKPWTGAWIFGVRYVELRELLNHSTFASEHIDPITAEVRGPAEMDYVINVDNDLVGFHFGLEAMRTVVPGLLIGGDVEAGVYGNSVKSNTRITA